MDSNLYRPGRTTSGQDAERGCIRKLFPCFRRPALTEEETSLPDTRYSLSHPTRSDVFQSCDDMTDLAKEVSGATRATRLIEELGVTIRMLRELPDLPQGSDEACQRVEEEIKSLEAVVIGGQASASSKTPKDKFKKVVHAIADQKALGIAPGSLASGLNRMIELLWPRIDGFVQDMIHDSIEPSINASLPGLLKGGVKFPKVSLGDASPLLGPIVVHNDEDSGAIEMHVGIDFTSELDIELLVMGMPVGVTSFMLKGDLVMLFTPPMQKPPFFGGVQIYFPNPPDINLDFVGAAKVANVPGLRGAVRGAIDGAVAGVCVLPRRIAVDLNDEDDVDIIDLTHPEPLSVLRFTLYSGEGLVAADTNLFGQASSDPYVVASLGVKKWTSPHVSKTLNPVWSRDGLTVDFPVHDDDQSLILKVYDYDFGTADDLIGLARKIDVKDLVSNGSGKQVVQLMKADETPGGGSLTISAVSLSLAHSAPSSPPAMPGPSEAHLSAKVLTIRGLKEHAEFPFKVAIHVVHAEEAPKKAGSAKARATSRASQGSAKQAILAEGSTEPSKPKEVKQLAEALQGIAKNLHKKSVQPKDIAEILDVGPRQVEQYLDELEHTKTKEQIQAEQEYLNVRTPVLEEVVQFLLPNGTVDENAVVELIVTDKKSKVLGTARIPVPDIQEAPEMHLEGPFTTDVEGLEVVGTLRFTWLA